MEIRTLPTEVIDQIAAGEVVERPAHLLKELVENSVDAGATRVEIEVGEGCRSISVTDDGKGVLAEDLPLVLQRHATSKISQADDLWNLHTFGFRGEALASISAVSELSILSRRRGEEKAYRLNSLFGKPSPLLEASHAEGTTIQVDALFNNIPARLKFLKSESAEFTLMKNVVKAMAMQYPQVEWKLKKKGELVYLFSQDESLQERVQKVLEVKKLYETQGEYNGYKARIIFSDPSQVAKVSRNIWIFVQNRWVQDKSLQAAVMEAYRSLLMHGQYPICYVSLECPPDQVDVNIHPTKSQVKFLDSGNAFRAVYHPLRQALEKAPWLATASATTPSTTPISRAPTEPVQNLSFQTGEMQKTQFRQKWDKPVLQQTVGRAELNQAAQGRDSFFEKLQNPTVKSDPQSQSASEDVGDTGDAWVNTDSEPQENVTIEAGQSLGYWGQLQVIGQVDLTYIVAQASDKMVLVDQHAAHERVAFERLMRSWQMGKFSVQSSLIPLVIDLGEAEVEALLRHQESLLRMGIEVEQAGPASLAIASQPAALSDKSVVEGLKKMASECLELGESFTFEKIVGDIFATMACHSVVRAGQALSQGEMEALLKDMDEFPLSGFCPHGRSVSLEFPFVRLEKDFGRRV